MMYKQLKEGKEGSWDGGKHAMSNRGLINVPIGRGTY